MQKYKEVFLRKSTSGWKTKYIDKHIQYLLNLINTDPYITSTQISENQFENFEDIKISLELFIKH